MVERDVIFEDLRNVMFLIDRIPWASPCASPAANTFVRPDVKLIGKLILFVADVLVNTIDRTDADASGIETINAKAGYDPRHG
jgi:hypothetical protein